jgi:hypothetical protein
MEPEVRSKTDLFRIFLSTPRGAVRHPVEPSLTLPPLLSCAQPSPAEIMRQQEEQMRTKYGDLKPKKKLIHKVRATTRCDE